MMMYQLEEILLSHVELMVRGHWSIPGREVLVVVTGLLLVMITQHHTLLIQHWLLDSTCTGVE